MTNSQAPQPAHTPGPWLIEQDGAGIYVVTAKMLVASPAPIDPYPTDSDEFTEGPVTEANARLIAAAPELLDMAECLRAVCARVIEQYGPVQCGVDFASLGGSVNRVLAKVNGEAA